MLPLATARCFRDQVLPESLVSPGSQAILNLRPRHRNGEFELFWGSYATLG